MPSYAPNAFALQTVENEFDRRRHFTVNESRPLQISADFETALFEVCAYLPDFCVPDERDLRYASTGSNFNRMNMKISIRWTLIFGLLGLIWGTHLLTAASSFFTSQRVLQEHARQIMTNVADLAQSQS